MFTGIIRDIGKIHKVEQRDKDCSFWIQTALDLDDIEIGASIACSGCCLTITEKDPRMFKVDVSVETLSKTTIGSWQVGSNINLEPSLKMGDELGGHFVFGHVDCLASLKSVTKDGESFRLKIEIPDEFRRFVAPKGSVALDGISLTVNEVEDSQFGVNIIPHTWNKTTLAYKQEGDFLNMEADMLARYVSRQLGTN